MSEFSLSLHGPRSGPRAGGFSTRLRRLDLHLLEWSRGGSWRLDLASATIRVPPGRVLFVPAGERHRLRVPPGVHLHSTWLNLHGEEARGRPVFAGWAFPTVLTPRDSLHIRRVITDLANLDGMEERCARIAAAGDIARILARCGEAPPLVPGPAHARLAEVLAAIDERIADPSPLRRLAQRVGVGHARLHELFHEAVGCAPGEYILRRRILAAQRLLAESSAPLEVIATACGITSAPYLCRLFRQRTGMTPGQWRKRPDRGLIAS